MSEPNELRTVVEEYFQRVDGADVDGLIELFTEDAVYERPGYPSIVGKDLLRRFYVCDRIIASGAHRVEGVLVEGDWASAWGQFSGTSRDGARLNERWCDVYEFVGIRIHYRRTHFFREAV